MVVDVIFRRRLREQEQQQRQLHQVLRQQRPEHLQDDRSSGSSRNTNGGGGGGRLWWWWRNAPAAAAPPGSPPQVTSAASFARGSRRSNRSLIVHQILQLVLLSLHQGAQVVLPLHPHRPFDYCRGFARAVSSTSLLHLTTHRRSESARACSTT
ncbi:hypothetical protein NFJ02_04g117450 [Pycnococcus provasolii]